MDKLNIALIQINPTLGNFDYNLNKVLEVWRQVDGHSHIVIFPEFALSGFFPADLFFETDFLVNLKQTIQRLVKASENFNSTIIIGTPYFDRGLFNSALIVKKGTILAGYHKRCLDEAFNEVRYFQPGVKPLVINFNTFKIGVSIGWDCWKENGWFHFYNQMDVDLLINLGVFPYYQGSFKEREKVCQVLAQRFNAYVACVNLIGGQERWVFDGRSFVVDPYEETVTLLSGFEEDFCILSIDYDTILRKKLSNVQLKKEEPCEYCFFDEVFLEDRRRPLSFKGKIEAKFSEEEEVYKALVLALRDYVEKSGFKKVVLGLSGGIDSSLVACIAVDALGQDRVVGVFMPSPFTSKESKEDAMQLAQNLGIEFLEYPIDEVFEIFRKTFGYPEFDVADENLQARLRANILFYLSNKKGYLVLCTSNKSEAAVGYGTLYGDIAGGFAPIVDVYKTMVYRLAKYRNSLKPDIPERVLLKVPSAELRPGQTDYEVLPTYEILDQILELYLEKKASVNSIIEKGFEKSVVEKVLSMVKKAEFKRKQAPFGPKVTKTSMVADRIYPVF